VVTAVLLIVLIGVCAAGISLVQRELKATRRDAGLHSLITAFPPINVAAEEDPRQLLRWAPLVMTARRLFPEEFAELDRAGGHPFPFGKKDAEAAHARWTADWLSWERTHHETYRVKAARAESEIGHLNEDPSIGRARLAAVEREKLELYQQRYEEYIRISKALTALDL
jgi:hypothetical protein